MPKLKFRAEWPRPWEIFDYYRTTRSALDELCRRQDGVFATMASEEAEIIMARAVTELEDEVVMLLAASFEAMLQVDLRDRVKRKGKDTPAKRLRRLWRDTDRKQFLTVERILDEWKELPEAVSAIGRLNQLFQYRHWLAHGRYWQQKSGLTRVDPFDAWQIGRVVFRVLPGFHWIEVDG